MEPLGRPVNDHQNLTVSFCSNSAKVLVVSKENSTFCPHPFKYLMVSPMGLIKPCCRFRTSSQTSDFSWNGLSQPLDIFRGAAFDRVRDDMRANRPVNGCETCQLEETTGVQSMRQKVMAREELPIDEDVHLTGLEIGFSRICNLACVSCNGHYSTAWEKFETALYGQKNLYHKSDFKWSELPREQLSRLKSLKVTGGEPLLSPEFFKFIRRLVQEDVAPQMQIEIFTNCTIKPKISLLKDLEHFKKVEINLSIDSIRERNSYIRFQSTWEEICSVSQVWRMARLGMGNLKIGFAVTISTLNVLDAVDLYDWIYTHFKNIEIHNQILVDPPQLSLYSLSGDTAKRLQNLFSYKKDAFLKKHAASIYHTDLFQEIDKILCQVQAENGEHSNENLISFLNRLDAIRKSNWRNTFPELASALSFQQDLAL